MVALDDNELVLTLDLEPGTNVDAVVAAESLIAWVAAIKEANTEIDPNSTVTVGLISADASCLRLRAALNFIEDTILGAPADALNEWPKIKKIAVATVLAVPAGVIVGGAIILATPTPTVNLSPEAIEILTTQQEKIKASEGVKSKVETFYRTVSRDKSVTNVSVAESVDSPALLSVPRAQFPEMAGLWEMQAIGPHERPQGDVWDVVVTYPAMKAAALSWGFERDGLPFSAKMDDPSFLSAIRDGTLPIVIQEGVHMQVEIEWRERLVGQVWEVISRTRRITRVLSPRPVRTAGGPLLRDH